jgi:hypothetical protein
VPRIEEYEFGRVLVDGEVHRQDVIVLPGRVVAAWWRREGHGLVLEDLQEVLDELPARQARQAARVCRAVATSVHA